MKTLDGMLVDFMARLERKKFEHLTDQEKRDYRRAMYAYRNLPVELSTNNNARLYA